MVNRLNTIEFLKELQSYLTPIAEVELVRNPGLQRDQELQDYFNNTMCIVCNIKITYKNTVFYVELRSKRWLTSMMSSIELLTPGETGLTSITKFHFSDAVPCTKQFCIYFIQDYLYRKLDNLVIHETTNN